MSLSESHTSGTALQDAYVCLLAVIYCKFLNTHKYFPKIERLHVLMAILGYFNGSIPKQISHPFVPEGCEETPETDKLFEHESQQLCIQAAKGC